MQRLYDVIEGEVEAAQFFIDADCPIVGKPLAEIKFKPNVLVGAIIRGKKVIIPRGQDVVEGGDHVILVTKDLTLDEVADVLD